MTAFSQPERRGLERMQMANPEVHPDADLLSAFAEQALTGRERDQVLTHLGACAACREVVALAGSPLVEPVPEPARKRGLWEMPLFRWGTVAASTVVVVAAVMLTVHQPSLQKMQSNTAAIQKEELPRPVQNEDRVVAEPTTKTQAAVQPEPAAPAETAAAPVTHRTLHLQQQARYERASPTTEKKEAAPAAVGGVVGGIVAPAPMAGAGARDSASGAYAALKTRAGDAKQAPAAAPVMAPPPSSATQNVTVSSANESVTVENSPLNKDEQVSNGYEVSQLSTNGKLDSAAASMMRKAPVASPQWQVNKGKLLQRSQAKTWLSVLPGHKFRAVASTQDSVWAGGDNGLLYHSADNGQTWAQVPVHSGTTALTGDIVAIEFSDPLHGSLQTSTGESWTTADGGQSWQKK